MKAKSKLVAKAFYYQRYLGVFLTIIGVPILITNVGPNSDFPLMIGLFTIFTSMEKVEDERSMSIKMSSLYIAFIFSYAVNLLSTNLYSHKWIPFHLHQINHFVILVFAMALIIYFMRMRISKE